MTRIVIKVHSGMAGPDQFYLDEAPSVVPGADKLCALTPNFAAPPFSTLKNGVVAPDVVKIVGETLFNTLIQHNAVDLAFAFAMARPDDLCPVYIQVQTDSDVEEVAWETLRPTGKEALALSRMLPLGRITSATGKTSTEQTFEPPLRMMACLSAAGVPAQPEWDALVAAVRATSLQVKLRVLVGEEQLLEAIAADLAANPLPNGSVAEAAYLPGIPEDFLAEIGAFAPNVLHFFCHGSTENGPHLQLATRADWVIGARSSLVLDTGTLRSVPGAEQFTWLVTLNCCLGGASVDRAHSLARSLVTRGFPAVIGMREPIDVTDANVFTKALYNELFSEVASSIAPGTTSIELCWPRIVASPRRYLLQIHTAPGAPPHMASNGLKEWTLPVLYVQRAPFKLLQPSSNAALGNEAALKVQVQLKTLLDVRETLRHVPNVPPSALDELDDKIAELGRQLYG